MRWAKAAKQGQLANLKTAGHGQQTYHPSLPQPHFSSFFLRGMHGSCSELIQHIFIFFCMNWSVGKNYSKKNAKVRAVITSTFIYSNIVGGGREKHMEVRG